MLPLQILTFHATVQECLTLGAADANACSLVFNANSCMDEEREPTPCTKDSTQREESSHKCCGQAGVRVNYSKEGAPPCKLGATVLPVAVLEDVACTEFTKPGSVEGTRITRNAPGTTRTDPVLDVFVSKNQDPFCIDIEAASNSAPCGTRNSTCLHSGGEGDRGHIAGEQPVNATRVCRARIARLSDTDPFDS